MAAARPVVEEGGGEDMSEDYMSDLFLQAAPPAPMVDPRQSMPSWKRKAKQRGRDADAHAARKRPKASLKEDIKEGLSKPIAAGNKGFDMLLKMGFKQGQGLGATGKGKKEPVGVEIKDGRRGLGWEFAVQQQQRARTQARQVFRRRCEERTGNLVEDFRVRKRREFVVKQAERDLPASQRACQQLDEEMGVTESELWFRLPPPEDEYAYAGGAEGDYARPRAVDGSGGAPLALAEGAHPGGEAEADILAWIDAEAAEPAAAEPEAGKAAAEVQVASAAKGSDFELLGPLDQLEIVTTYLRATHSYCHWCGRVYADARDMEAACPGPTWDDHQ